MAWLAPVEGLSAGSSTCRRIQVAPGVEVLMDEQHPALRLNGDPAVIAEAFRQSLATLVGMESSPTAPVELREAVTPAWSPIQSASELFDNSTVSTEPPG